MGTFSHAPRKNHVLLFLCLLCIYILTLLSIASYNCLKTCLFSLLDRNPIKSRLLFKKLLFNFVSSQVSSTIFDKLQCFNTSNEYIKYNNKCGLILI